MPPAIRSKGPADLGLRGETPLLILQYLYDRVGRMVPVADLEVVMGKDIHALRPAIEDLKTEGYINEEEYRICLLYTSRCV